MPHPSGRAAAFVSLSVLAGGAWGNAEGRRAPDIDLAEIQQRGALRVLVVLDPHRPEFFQTKPGAAPGFDHEMLDGFCNLHKLKLDVVVMPGWDALIPALIDKKGDLVAGRFTATESRKKLVDFTDEVFPTRNVVINRKPHKPIASLEELRAEKVGTTKGSSMVEAIAAAGVPAASVDDSVATGDYGEALKSGKISAAVWGVESAIALQREDPAVQLGIFLGRAGSLAYAVRKGDAQLLAALNQYIDNVRKTPTWSRLVVKYFGEAAPEILKKARSE